MRWQKRFFVLHQPEGYPAQLTYYKDEDIIGNEARATLELTSGTKIDFLLGKPCAFQIILKGRALKVAAETTEAREAWMECLRDCIVAPKRQTVVQVRSHP